jgi:allophycocyanin beta subunit
MQDAITSVINSADVQGKYLDGSAMDRLKNYFSSGELRVRAATTISANAAAIVKEAVAKSLLYSDITRPGLLPPLCNLCHVGWRPFHLG